MSSNSPDQTVSSKSDYYETTATATTKNDSASCTTTTTDSSSASASAAASSSPGCGAVAADPAGNANVTTAANADAGTDDGASSSSITTSRSVFSHDDQQGEQSSISDSSSSSSTSTTIRDVVGTGSMQLSDTINENIIIARHITIASIGLLTAYGISHTPLFSRYKTVSDVPSSYFLKRKYITCRVIQQQSRRIQMPQPPEGPIQLQVRNLSPFERILPLSLYDWFMKMHPASALSGKMRPDESSEQLLQVELAGVQTPPDYLSYEKEQYGDWLTDFVKQRPVVKCQLLARRVILDKDGAAGKRSTTSSLLSQQQQHGGKTFKRQIPGFEIEKKDDKDLIQYSPNQIAHCKIYYRREWLQLFSTDLAVSMVLNGRASVISDGNGLYGGTGSRRGSNEKIVDTQSTSVSEIRKDVTYVDQLLEAQHEAASELRGMWSDSNIRNNHNPDLMKEIEFQCNATMWQKFYRFLKGG